MIEVWKDIEGYEGMYQVSNLGRVKSLGNRSNHKDEILLKQANVMGYKVATLTKDSKGKMYKVHRLVATAFISNDDLENKIEVNHIDGDKFNNKASNLEWCTKSENAIHAFKLGLRDSKKGIENILSIKIIQIDPLDNSVIAEYGSLREMERETGFNRGNVSRACKDETSSAYGWKWKYAE